jgi:nicotinamide-nucleotide amidase
MAVPVPIGCGALRGGAEGAPPPTAVVVGVGDELLFGQTVDTNGAWLAQELSSLGFTVLRRWVVADRRDEIQAAVAQGMALSDLVILTGGLGPTPDDLTRPAVAELLNAPLQEDPKLVTRLEERAQARGHDGIQANIRLMALVPRGARVLENPKGAAPGLVLEGREGSVVILLPGPPREVKGVYLQSVLPFLTDAFRTRLAPAYHRMILTTGVPESVLSREMTPLLPHDLGLVSIAFLPDLRGVRVRLTARGIDEAEAEKRFDLIEEPLKAILDPYRFQAASGDLAEALGLSLLSAGATLAVAESCTGGLIAKRMTDHPGSSRYFLGGIVAYDNAVKVEQLGVSEEVLEAEGAVSQAVAEAMACGVARRFAAQAGIGITGVAGPSGGTEGKPVGTIWFAASFLGHTVSRLERFPGDREAVREFGAQAAMALLFRLLEGGVPSE